MSAQSHQADHVGSSSPDRNRAEAIRKNGAAGSGLNRSLPVGFGRTLRDDDFRPAMYRHTKSTHTKFATFNSLQNQESSKPRGAQFMSPLDTPLSRALL